jgi:hypothetical protein
VLAALIAVLRSFPADGSSMQTKNEGTKLPTIAEPTNLIKNKAGFQTCIALYFRIRPTQGRALRQSAPVAPIAVLDSFPADGSSMQIKK